MLEGWYSRSIADEAAAAEEEERVLEESKFKKEYKYLKRKFQNLIFENESFQQALRLAQKRLLLVTRDRTFLLDRLLMHEKVEHSTSESDDTESSDDGEIAKPEPLKKRRDVSSHSSHTNIHHANSGKVLSIAKKKKPPVPRPPKQQIPQTMLQMPPSSSALSDGHMTPEEVERHLQAQSFMEFLPERAPPTVPTEMFSNEPSLDSESNDVGELETSPSNIGEEISIDMIVE
ncbi:INO80 complex subunit E isoform X2 [Diorhabda carinulata]|uniref:INO80 complex subunit E isoform X2 n=1 Tax=Diorhabda sublineata TaxID=1163346 RepID=UPI0024E0B564|nr:INO80 complex subunit E isoform X2 [Diorhabda sublineata]XP_057671363.1 INO80 complex subunit E isoform X2 [Diorhabda carinulata]